MLNILISLWAIFIVAIAIVLAYFRYSDHKIDREDPPTESWLDSDPFVLAHRAIDRHVTLLRSLQRTSAGSLAREAPDTSRTLVDGLNEILALVPQANNDRDGVLFESPSDTGRERAMDTGDESLALVIQPDIDAAPGTVFDGGPGFEIGGLAVTLSGSAKDGPNLQMDSTDSVVDDDETHHDKDDVQHGDNHKDTGAQHSAESCETTKHTEKDECVEEACDIVSQKSDESKNFRDYCVHRRGSIFLQTMQNWAKQAKIVEELVLETKHEARERDSIFLQKIRCWAEQLQNTASDMEAQKFVNSSSSKDKYNSNSALLGEDMNGTKLENDSTGVLPLVVEEDTVKESGSIWIEDNRILNGAAEKSSFKKLNGCLIFCMGGVIVLFCLYRAMRN